MTEVRSLYPKILHLGRQGTEELFDDDVTIQEKLDGSQLRFGFDSRDVLRFYSRGSEQTEANKLFAPAIAEIRKRTDILDRGAVYYGEVLAKPKHNLLAYERVPSSHFALFDIYYIGGWGHAGDVFDVALELGFEPIPTFYVGKANREGLSELLDRRSCLGGIIEGIVIKNYTKGIFAKLVADDFKEIKGQPPGPSPAKDGTTIEGVARILVPGLKL